MATYRNFDELPIMLSVPQAADVLGISDVTLYRIIKADPEFPAFRLTRRVTIPKQQFIEWINNNIRGKKISGY